MVFEIANPDDTNNRIHGVPTTALDQGVLTALNASQELVAADATNGAQGQAQGALFTQVEDISQAKYSMEPVQNQAREHYNLVTTDGDKRGTIIREGFLMVNRDTDPGFTPGLPVYLADNGGVTQTAPTTSGSVVQKVGVAQESNSFLLDIEMVDSNDVNA